MYKYLAVLFLATTAAVAFDSSQNIPEETLFDIFGSPDQPPQSGPASVTQSPVIEKNEQKYKPCITNTRVEGICVYVYLCRHGSIITDGSGLIDVRFKGVCNTGEVCCALSIARTLRLETLPTPTIQNPRTGCGWRNDNRLGPRFGADLKEEAKVTEFPWMVALFTTESLKDVKDKDKVYIGGGSLIHPSVVLTAAHKVKDFLKKKTIGARVGEWKRNSTMESSPHQEREVVEIEVHDDFSRANLFYDVAVLFMESPFHLPAPNVGLICLPPPTPKVSAGTRCTVSGWGTITENIKETYQSVLQKVEVPVVDYGNCQEMLRQAPGGSHLELHSSLMCAGGEEDKDACFGDGGSPLVCPVEMSDTETRYMQSGIVAGGIGCGRKGVPGLYTDVANVRDWIDEVVRRRGHNTSTYIMN